MMRFLISMVIAFGCVALAATPAQWRSQSIYQVLTDRFARTDGSTTATCNTADRVYCGGSYQGIINHLDYIQGMGFTAIWISPVTYNIPQDTKDGESYHGYWQQNIYALNTNFGTASDLKALASALHARGMLLMVDVVANHFGWDGPSTDVDYTQLHPFNSQSYYHAYCEISNYDNQTDVEDCWLGDTTVSLPDLKTENSEVASIYYSWIESLISNYSIDGLRIDTVKHVDKAFWPGFNSAAGVFCTGEIFVSLRKDHPFRPDDTDDFKNGDPAYTCPYQEVLDSVLNYPIYFPLVAAFESSSGSITNLVNELNSVKSSCKDSTLLGSFSENHDNPRFPSYSSDMSLVKNVIAYTILADGVPIIYEGQEQHYSGGNDPANREAVWLSGYSTTATLYTHIKALNQVRTLAITRNSTSLTYKNYVVYNDSNTIVMRKGFDGNQIVTVLSNQGASGSSYALTLTESETGFTTGEKVVEVLSCTSATVDSSGSLSVPMASGLPRVYYPATQLSGSGICGNTVDSSSSAKSPSTTHSTSTSTNTCTTATAIAITFEILVTTAYGETIKICGNTPQLGNWDASTCPELSSASYAISNPVWSTTTSLTAGTNIQYKYVNVASDGSVTWEIGPNRSYTVPVNCATTVTKTDTWR